mgnify:FL=1
MNRLKRTFGKLKQWFLHVVIGRFLPKYLEYNDIKEYFGKNDEIASLNDGKTYKYSGYLTLVGSGKNAKGYDSFNDALVVYKGGKLAALIEKGIDHEHIKSMKHIQNVRSTCKRLGCTPSELIKKNYMTELGYD